MNEITKTSPFAHELEHGHSLSSVFSDVDYNSALQHVQKKFDTKKHGEGEGEGNDLTSNFFIVVPTSGK